MRGSRRAAGLVVVAGALAASLMPAAPALATHMGCGLLGLEKCPHVPAAAPAPKPPAPDPGGSEADVPLPPPAGKQFGFSAQLSFWATTPAHEVRLLRQLKAGVQRYTINWKGLQPTASSPPLPSPGRAGYGYLAKLDALYAELTAHGMRPVIVIGEAPVWATDYARCDTFDNYCRSVQNMGRLHPGRGNVADYRRFVAAVAAHYPQAAIETWNEPNIVTFWRPTPPDPAFMKSLQCAAYGAVKALPSANIVTSPGLATFATPRNDGSPMFESYLENLYARGIKECMDALSLHMYPANVMSLGEGSPFAAQFEIARRVKAKYGDARPMWIGETGSTSFPNSGSYKWGITEAQQVDLNNRLYNRLATMPDVSTIIFYTLRNLPTQSLTGHYLQPAYHFGFLRDNWSPKPVWCTFLRKAQGAGAPC